jgi:hypothetical protein
MLRKFPFMYWGRMKIAEIILPITKPIAKDRNEKSPE